MSLPTLLVYSRPGCHLCDHMVEELLPLIRGRARVDIVNIETNSDWLRRFGVRIPVLELDGDIVCEGHLDRAAVADALEAGAGTLSGAPATSKKSGAP